MSDLCEAMGSLCTVLKEWHAVGIYHLLKEWQTLIAGAFGLLAGIIAYVGAMRAAKRQVDALRAERVETDRRRRSVAKWAVRAEGARLEQAVLRARHPSGPNIGSSPILRAEREDVAFLDDETLAALQRAASIIDTYDAMAGQPRRTSPHPGAALLDELETLAVNLQK